MADPPPEHRPPVISPRLEAELQLLSQARRKAQAMHSVEELQRGLHDDDWRVRQEVVDRLVARGGDDRGTLPELLMAAREDPAWQVRSAALMRLSEFDPVNVLPVLHEVANDPHPEVRWAARYSLNQLGENWNLDG